MKFLLRQFVCASLLCSTFSNAKSAEQDQISSDRPDFLKGPEVVGKGRFQIEFGGLVQRDDSDTSRIRLVTTPTLLRLGVTEQLEMRFETDGRVRTRETVWLTETTVHEHGWGNATVGVKWNSHKANAETGMPSIGWLVEAELPSGSHAFRGRGIRPAITTALQFELPDNMDVVLNAGIKYDNDDVAGRFWSPVLGAGFSKGLGNRMRVLAEIVAPQIAKGKYGGNVVIADVAMTYLLTNSIQLDALVGGGLTNESPKYVFTVGISARF